MVSDDIFPPYNNGGGFDSEQAGCESVLRPAESVDIRRSASPDWVMMDWGDQSKNARSITFAFRGAKGDYATVVFRTMPSWQKIEELQ